MSVLLQRSILSGYPRITRPYDNNLGSPFIPPDFTLGLPSIQDWPCQAREPPWILGLEECPKPVRKVLVDSTRTSSMDEGEEEEKEEEETSSFQEIGETRA